MKKILSLVLMFFLVSLSYSQEVCDNAIDDDNDGLIDLNDLDCSCGQSISVPSLIPNPSFEEYDYCPTNYSQLDAASNWIQATYSTSDYFNTNLLDGTGTCDFVLEAMEYHQLDDFPNGNACVGALYLRDWNEYVGTTLLSTLVAGTNYKITLNIAAMVINPYGEHTDEDITSYEPVNVTIYGCNNGTNLPVPTTISPNLADPTWFEIGHVTYSPTLEWSTVTIDFTPTFNVNAVMIGPPPILPNTYPFSNIDVYPYFLYDNLLLNETTYFNDITIQVTGDFCNNNVVLTNTIAIPAPTNTYQWYLNGVAIIGATSGTYNVTTYSANDSYSLRVYDGVNCFLSNSLQLNTITPNPPTVVSPVTFCQNETASTLTATGTSLLWYTTASGGTGSSTPPVPSTTVAGTFNYYVSQTCLLESIRQLITVVVNPLLVPNFSAINQICAGETTPILNTVSPNGIVGTWSPSSISSTQSGSYVFTPNTNVCAYNQILNITVIEPIVFNIIGGCSNEKYYMEAIANGTFDLNNVTFQWFDSNGNTIGANNPVLNVTEIVDSTIENENFPLTYGLTITDNFGCETTKTYEIDKVYCKIPKGISPNNDNQNDFFDLRGLHVAHLDIFNRYGMKVYGMDNYTTEWKGQNKNGDLLPDGTYYYYIEFENDNPKTGWVYLQKNN
jgi:gliding motility-associated-like protein